MPAYDTWNAICHEIWSPEMLTLMPNWIVNCQIIFKMNSKILKFSLYRQTEPTQFIMPYDIKIR